MKIKHRSVNRALVHQECAQLRATLKKTGTVLIKVAAQANLTAELQREAADAIREASELIR